jgi:hypothetical protein
LVTWPAGPIGGATALPTLIRSASGAPARIIGATAVGGTWKVCPGCIIPSNNVLPSSVMRTHAGAVAVSTTGPCGLAAGAGAGRCGAGLVAAAGAAVAAGFEGCSSERRLSRLMITTSRITAITAESTSHFGMVRAGSAASITSACDEAKRWPPISSRSWLPISVRSRPTADA